MWYDPTRMSHKYYKGWPRLDRWPTGTTETLAAERRYDMADSKSTWIMILRIASYVVTALLSALGASAVGL